MRDFFRVTSIAVLSLFAAISTGASRAGDPVAMKWDCYLTSGMSCEDLRKGILSGLRELKETDSRESATFFLKFRSQSDGQTAHYQAFVFKKGNASDDNEKADFKYIIDIPSQMASEQSFLKVLAQVQYLVLFAFEPSGPATSQDGLMMMSFQTPDPDPRLRQNQTDTNWYNSTSLGGSFNKAEENGNLNLNGFNNLSWSNEDWKFTGTGIVDYQKFDFTESDAEGNLVPKSEEVFSYMGTTLIARTLSEHWSVALIATAGRSLSDNIKFGAQADVGVEWILVPVLKTNENSALVRYTIGLNHSNFNSPSLRDRTHETYLTHELKGEFSRHFDRVDLSLSLTGSSVLDKIAYSKLTAGVSTTFRVTNDFQIIASFNLTLQNRNINDPGAHDLTGVQQYLQGNRFAKISTSSALMFSYNFGNKLWHTQNRRWKRF